MRFDSSSLSLFSGSSLSTFSHADSTAAAAAFGFESAETKQRQQQLIWQLADNLGQDRAVR